MITDKQKELIKMLEEEINNLEIALRKNKVEQYMIPLVKRKIEEKKRRVYDIKLYDY